MTARTEQEIEADEAAYSAAVRSVSETPPAADELLQDSPAARPCVHQRVHHEHGTLGRYKQDRCRCPECTEANRDYDRNRLTQISHGRWAAYADAEPIRSHVYDLLWSKTLTGIATESGVSIATIRRLMFGNRRRGSPPAKRLLTETADRLTGVKSGRRTTSENPDLFAKEVNA